MTKWKNMDMNANLKLYDHFFSHFLFSDMQASHNPKSEPIQTFEFESGMRGYIWDASSNLS